MLELEQVSVYQWRVLEQGLVPASKSCLHMGWSQYPTDKTLEPINLCLISQEAVVQGIGPSQPHEEKNLQSTPVTSWSDCKAQQQCQRRKS